MEHRQECSITWRYKNCVVEGKDIKERLEEMARALKRDMGI
jgi:hypothetical protein